MGSEEKIMGLFRNRSQVRFSDVEKTLNLPSTKTAHVLNSLMKKGWIGRNGSTFILSKTGQKLVPKIEDSEIHKKKHPEFAIMLLIKHNGKWLLEKKHKPFHGYWGLLSTEPTMKESIEEACIRTIKNKTNYNSNISAFRGIIHQRFEKSDSDVAYAMLVTELKISNFELIKTSSDFKWFDMAGMEKIKMIPSDKWAIRKFFNQEIPIYETHLGENHGLLTDFKVNELN